MISSSALFRKILVAGALALAPAVASVPANAQEWGIYIQDGYSNYGRPDQGNPYWEGRRSRGYSYDRYSQVSPQELSYYCSMGSQTPVSVRQQCVEAGYWGQDNRRSYRGESRSRRSRYYDERREPSMDEIAYYCGLGSQTPVSVRKHCVRYGFWQ